MFFLKNDEEARHILELYYSILANERQAGYLICKSIPVDVALDAPEDELWSAHSNCAKDLHERDSHYDGDKKTKGQPSLLDLKCELAKRIMSSCAFCERRCSVNRPEELGFCKVGEPKIASEFLHMGEEPELIPSHTLFFSGCTFKCVFCQNYDISQFPKKGAQVSEDKVATIIGLTHLRSTSKPQNVNWVGGDPTPNLSFILNVLRVLEVNTPQVWNSNMYLTESSMALLDGVVDLYLTDFKYGNDECARRLSKAKNYWEIITRNHLEANRQCDMIIRHLVLPNHLECCTYPIMDWISENLDNSKVRVNIMDQYHPEWKAHDHQDINRRLKASEFSNAVRYGTKLVLNIV